MKRNWLAGVMLMVCSLCPAIGFANAAAPEPDKPPEPPRPLAKQVVPFKITGDRTAEEHRLIIPRKFLENAQAAGVKRAGVPGSDVRTMIAGLAISVSVVSLVLLVIRKKSRATQAVAVFIAIGGGLIWMNYAAADVAPPYSEIPQNWKGQVSVRIEITDQGDVVELILGTDRRHTEPPSRRGPVPPNTGSAAPSQPKSEPPTSESAPKANPK